jgi:protein-L-isoaspartate(D-aspartate) O-methyltransferase
MVVRQLERRGIRDSRVLAVMRRVPRHRFVMSDDVSSAYDDGPLPIGAKQTISQPYMVALMSEIAMLAGSERVLEIGTGSGYQTALLASLAAEIWSIERIDDLYNRSRRILDEFGFRNLHLRVGDGSVGWEEAAPFDVIMVTAAMPRIPRELIAQLAPDGRLIGPVGDAELQTLVRISRVDGHWREEYFGECRFVKMTGRDGFSA